MGRGQDPFSEFVKHQEETICVLAIGGSLNTLGGSTGLGSNLAEKQDDQFQSIITLDAKKIQNTINSSAVPKVCRWLGQEQMCRFQFIEKDNTTPAEYLDMAAKARDLGAAIDLSKLKDVTGLQFISLPSGNQTAEVEAWSPTVE